MEESVRVLAVDDQSLARRALAALVGATEGFTLVGEAASGSEALAAVAALDPELVLLDVRMPAMDGFETARRITGAGGNAVVVLVSTDERPGDSDRARAAGAVAIVLKQRLARRVLRELWARHLVS